MFSKPAKKPKLMPLDILFKDYLESLTLECNENYEKYNFNYPAQKLRQFLWDIFASNYVELVKNRAYNENKNFSEEESNSAKWTLHFLQERFLTLTFPIIPQITSMIANDKKINLLEAEWPKSEKVSSDLSLVDKILEFNSLVWKEKKDKGISLKEGIEGVEIPKELKEFERDFRACHGI